jgi:hypothetical protein
MRLNPVRWAVFRSKQMKHIYTTIIFLFLFSCRPDNLSVTNTTNNAKSISSFILPSKWTETSARMISNTPHIENNHSLTETNTLYPSDTLTPTNTITSDITQPPTITRRPSRDPSSPCYDLSANEIKSTSEWKLFRSKSGWQIRYPPDWGPYSCRTCADPTAQGAMVSFGPLNTFYLYEGTVEMSGWYGGGEENIEICTINERHARRVSYKDKYGYVNESIYITINKISYGITFGSSEKKANSVEELEHYKIFQLMSFTFDVYMT